MTIPFDLSTATSYKAYFQNLAESNKVLNVSAEPYLYGDIEIGQNEASTWKGRKLWAWPSQRGRGSNQNDNYYLNREGSIWIGGPCNSEKHADEDTYYFECEAIMKQIISKMLFDYTEGKLATAFNSYVLARQDMNIGATLFIGCELVFTFSDPDGFEYDEDQWEVTP